MVKNKNISTEKSNGRVYTPDYIVDNILDLSGYYEENILKKHVIDNSCGDGAFLIKIVDRYCKACLKNNIEPEEIAKDLATYIHGIEIDQEEQLKCIENISNVAKSYGVFNVEWDVICNDTLVVKKYDNKMDFVLGNPPYIRIHNLGESFQNAKKFLYSQNGMTDLYIVFYEIGLKMLNQTGVLGYITPSSFFNSVAGSYMRKQFVDNNYLDKIVDLKHFQAFNATTYTTIVILKKNRENRYVEYYQFDEKNLIPYYVESLTPNDYCIFGNFYFARKEALELIKKTYLNPGHCDISVKNGYATLCDDAFINNFKFSSKYIIPVVKASKGALSKIIFPYDKNAKLIPEDEIEKDDNVYNFLKEHKNDLLKRSNEQDSDKFWYAYGRSQALRDTYKNKLAISTLLRHAGDLKLVDAPAGVGVYSGLYIISNSISMEEIKKALMSAEFANYVSLLGKYKSGGYYTFSSKDVKLFLDYKFGYNGGLFE